MLRVRLQGGHVLHLLAAGSRSSAAGLAKRVAGVIQGMSDVFLEVSFIDKISKQHPTEWLRSLERVTHDERVIFNAISFIRGVARVPEQRPGLLRDLATMYKDQLFARGSSSGNGAPRFHYTDVRFEPIAYAVMQKVVSFPVGGSSELTSEAWEFLSQRVPDGEALVQVMSAFVQPCSNMVRRLETLLGPLGGAGHLHAFMSETGSHKIAKQVQACPAPYRQLIQGFWEERITALSQQYDAALRRRKPVEVQQAWLACFDHLKVVYGASRLLRYAAASPAVLMVASKETVAAIMGMLRSAAANNGIGVMRE